MSEKNQSLVTQAYNQILDFIMTKQLMPGERIPETKIAKELGFSRSPIREALRTLANKGLINIYPHRFSEVATINENDFYDIGTTRVSLDTMAVKLALLNGNLMEFHKLKEIAEDCLKAHEDNNIPLRLKLDADFHRYLIEISRNKLFIKYQKELEVRVQFIILHGWNEFDKERKNLEQHLELVDALCHHDEERAIQIIQDHLITFYKLREKYPSSFFKNY